MYGVYDYIPATNLVSVLFDPVIPTSSFNFIVFLFLCYIQWYDTFHWTIWGGRAGQLLATGFRNHLSLVIRGTSIRKCLGKIDH